MIVQVGFLEDSSLESQEFGRFFLHRVRCELCSFIFPFFLPLE